MNVVIAIDSLKGSLSSLDAGKAIEKGIRKVYPDAQTVIRPLADGGEGTVEALSLGMGGHLETISVTGPAGRAVDATYGIIEETKTAIIEMSAAAGITLVTEEERNPLHTTTYGVGEMIKDAIHKGCRNFIVGIGGSATNDCGIGMLQALGFEFLDENGKQVAFGAKGIKNVVSVSDKNALAELKDCEFKIACDVTNPLCGPKGCSAIYGPQKGATPEMVEEMDQWLVSYADLVAQSFPKADRFKEGTGAAGGLGFAFLTFINASLQSGIDLVLKETSLEAFVKEADIVITGEGRLDQQTAMGKGPIGVAKIAKKHGKKVLAFAGCVTEDAYLCNEAGIDAYFPILTSVVSLEEALDCENAAKNMTSTAEQVFRLIKMCE